jgi:Acetyltransferase (GNAT) family
VIKSLDVLDGELADQAWKIYLKNFTPLATRAIQRHVMTRPEFDQVAADPRVSKDLLVDDAGTIAGMSTFTNHLDAVPLIAPEYFAHHWPELYERKAIWYIGFVLVDEEARGSELFTELILHYYRIAAAERGIVGLDVCTHNDVVRRLPRSIELVLRRHTGGASRRVLGDSQNYHLYDMDGSNGLVDAHQLNTPRGRIPR